MACGCAKNPSWQGTANRSSGARRFGSIPVQLTLGKQPSGIPVLTLR